jgi:hypothetical protein
MSTPQVSITDTRGTTTWSQFQPCRIATNGAGPFDFDTTETQASATVVNGWFNPATNSLRYASYADFNSFGSATDKNDTHWPKTSNIFTHPNFLDQTITIRFADITDDRRLTIANIFNNEITTTKYTATTGERVFFTNTIQSFPALGVD